MPLGTPAHFQSKDILTLSGDTLKKFSQEPKGLFESFKFEFISCVITEILSARSNPRDSKDRSWVSRFAFISFFLDVSACQRSFSQKCHHRESYSGVDRYIFAYFIDFFPLQISLHEEFYKRDIESWRNENSFALDLFVCATHDTSSPSHVLAERWRFSSGFRYTITARCRPLWLTFLFREPAEGEEWNAKAEHAKLQELQGALRAYISTCAIFLIFGEYSFSSSTFH